MKFQLTLKDPDGIYEGLINPMEQMDNEDLRNEMLTVLKTWFMYDEYITLEIDTELNTIQMRKAR